MLNKIFLLILLFINFQFTGGAQSFKGNPDPLRFAEQINTFTEWDERNSFPKDAVLFVGSSSIRLWKTHNAFPEYPIINRGFGGSHISDVQHYYTQVIRKYHPALILFYAGDNDIAADKAIDQVLEDYKELTDRILRDNPDVLFVYIPIKPSSSRWSYWEKMDKVNRMIRSYNNRHEQLYYVDLASPLLGSNGRPDDAFFLEDQLHLNDQGYEAWNRVMGPELEKLYSKSTEQQ